MPRAVVIAGADVEETEALGEPPSTRVSLVDESEDGRRAEGVVSVADDCPRRLLGQTPPPARAGEFPAALQDVAGQFRGGAQVSDAGELAVQLEDPVAGARRTAVVEPAPD